MLESKISLTGLKKEWLEAHRAKGARVQGKSSSAASRVRNAKHSGRDSNFFSFRNLHSAFLNPNFRPLHLSKREFCSRFLSNTHLADLPG
jgi:hypothetical protein